MGMKGRRMRKRRRERRMKIAERGEEVSEWREKEYVEKEDNSGRTAIE